MQFLIFILCAAVIIAALIVTLFETYKAGFNKGFEVGHTHFERVMALWRKKNGRDEDI